MDVPTLASIATDAVLVDARTRCPVVKLELARHPDATCIVAQGAGGRLDVLTRRRFTLEMAGPIGYGRALNAHRPLAALVDDAATLVLDPSCSLTTAGRLALERPRGRRYDDLLVAGPGDQVRTVSIADLFTALARVHEQRSLRDELTGLANRSGFAAAVAGALESGTPVAVLYVDLDEFKAVNNSLGHGAGDALLVEIADRLRSSSRASDVVARLGGDEFGLLLPGASAAEADLLAQRLLAILRAPVAVEGRSLTMRASIGVALGDGSASWEELLRNADLAMYEAKRSGKGQWAGYRAEMHERAVSRLVLATDLGHAVAQGELRLQYQPIVALAAERIVGVEALVRWQHPARGLIAPLDFIPAAEESGAIVEIGAWVLGEACHAVARWNGELGLDLHLGVNVSVRQLEADGFAGAVRHALAEAGIEPSRLTLEVTESALARETGAVLETLATLDRAGVRLAIDDFGTGYSSFARLERLPVGMLKIDRSLTARMHSGRGLGVMRGLLSMAAAMDLTALVEGVETAEEAELLLALGVELVQGYRFSRPLDSAHLTGLLSRATLPA